MTTHVFLAVVLVGLLLSSFTRPTDADTQGQADIKIGANVSILCDSVVMFCVQCWIVFCFLISVLLCCVVFSVVLGSFL